jgi:hypothetical protein
MTYNNAGNIKHRHSKKHRVHLSSLLETKSTAFRVVAHEAAQNR